MTHITNPAIERDGRADNQRTEQVDYTAETNKNPVLLSVIESVKPNIITKRYTLEGNDLRKDTVGNMSRGFVEVVSVDDARGFANLLSGLKHNQALCYGVPVTGNHRQSVVTNKEVENHPGAISRTRDYFQYRTEPGVMMLDCDAPKDGGTPLGKNELLHILGEMIPGFSDAAVVWQPSSSSHIHDGNGIDRTGLRGQRVYIFARDASDIPRAGKVLETKLWAAGYGRYEVSVSGQLLPRTIVDTSVWQPERLDFAAGAKCVAPLEQRYRDPEIIFDGEPLNTATALPAPDERVVAQAAAARAKKKCEYDDKVAEVKAEWIAERLAGLPEGATEEQAEGYKENLKRAINNKTLCGDFEIVMDSGETVLVGEILDDPGAYHQRKTKDPLEPSYDGGRTVGILYLYGGRPVLHSQAHGSCTFRLIRQVSIIELFEGQTHHAINQTMDLMRQLPDFYDYGEVLATVYDGRVVPFTEITATYHLAQVIQYKRWKMTRDGKAYLVNADPPPPLVKQLLGIRRDFKKIEAVVTAPILRLDGSLLNKAGYDPTSKIYYEPKGTPGRVIMLPSDEQVADAVEVLMKPFNDFPFESALDRSVLLSALLTAPMRPVLPTVPAHGFDAPAKGSGKTLLAKCTGIMLGEDNPPIRPPVAGREKDDEYRKGIMAALLADSKIFIIDNILGQFNSACIATALTAPNYSDRILGKSLNASMPNRMMFLLTGNNLTLAGDMPRRVLVCRIDPRTDRPYAREFLLDPESYVRDHRQEMIAAALTIIRGWLSAHERGVERVPGKMASFEVWDSFVRQTIAWLARRDNRFADVMLKTHEALDKDPEREALGDLLRSLAAIYDPAWGTFTASTISKDLNTYHYRDEIQALNDALRGVGVDTRNLTTRDIGKQLGYREGSIVDGLRLIRLAKKTDGVAHWAIEKMG